METITLGYKSSLYRIQRKRKSRRALHVQETPGAERELGSFPNMVLGSREAEVAVTAFKHFDSYTVIVSTVIRAREHPMKGSINRDR